jgi:hypothetical protein
LGNTEPIDLSPRCSSQQRRNRATIFAARDGKQSRFRAVAVVGSDGVWTVV